jgi:hypothetical protein
MRGQAKDNLRDDKAEVECDADSKCRVVARHRVRVAVHVAGVIMVM